MKKKSSKAMMDYKVLRHAARKIDDLPDYAYACPLDDIWDAELLPLIDASEELRNIHSVCVRAWNADNADVEKQKEAEELRNFYTSCLRLMHADPSYLDKSHLADIYSEAEHGGAWEFSRPNHWFYEIDRRAAKAAVVEQNPKAWLLFSIQNILCDKNNSILEEGLIVALMDAARELVKEVEPSREELCYWVPIGSAHYANVWGYYLAQAWHPGGDWRLIKKSGHTAVVDLDDGCVFDLFFCHEGVAEILGQLAGTGELPPAGSLQ